MGEELSRRPDLLEPSEFTIDEETARRFMNAFRGRMNLTTIDLPREMGFDSRLVSAQQIIYLAEHRGLMPRLYEALSVSTPEDLIPSMLALPKDGPVGKRLGGVALKIGLTHEDLSDPRSHTASFLSMVTTKEAVERLKQALTKLGY